jgi:hypothetical protein
MFFRMEQFDGTLIDSATIQPRYLKVRDAVRYSSISHTTFYELIASGEIRTVALLKKGNVAGIRLVDIQSLDEYLAKHAVGGDTQTNSSRLSRIEPEKPPNKPNAASQRPTTKAEGLREHETNNANAS